MIIDAALADAVCREASRVMRPRLRHARVDAPFETPDMRGTPACAAFRALKARAVRRSGRGDPNMGIPLDLARDEDWGLLADYASSSINVDFYDDPTAEEVGTLHDCGASITLRLTADQATELQTQPGVHLQVRPFPPAA